MPEFQDTYGWLVFLRGDDETVARNARWAALWTSLVVFVVSLFLWSGFDPTSAEYLADPYAHLARLRSAGILAS